MVRELQVDYRAKELACLRFGCRDIHSVFLVFSIRIIILLFFRHAFDSNVVTLCDTTSARPPLLHLLRS